jgi:predicted lipoprotein with Yx(FWY)xxD motif
MKRILASIVAMSAAALVVTGIGVTGSTAHSKPSRTARTARPSRVTASSALAVRRTQLGRTLVDARGRTLYLFEADRPNLSNCSNACLSVWPALTTQHRPGARGGAVASKIGTIPARGGKRQVTYAGRPLYYYVGDRKPGDTNGQGLNQFGAKWYVLSPAGKKIDND